MEVIILRIKQTVKRNIWIKILKSKATGTKLYNLYDDKYSIDEPKATSYNVDSFINKISYIKPNKSILQELKEI